jgi:hypothetical protein
VKTAGIVALLLLSFATGAHAQCAAQVVLNNRNVGGHVFVTLCGTDLPVKQGDAITIASDKQQITGTVGAIASAGGIERLDVVAGGPAASDGASLETFQATTANVTYNGTTVSATVTNRNSAVDVKRYTWAVGPATKADNSSTETDSSTPQTTSAMRLQFQGEYQQSGFFGRTTPAAKFETRGTLSIDTTSSDSTQFIDDNEVTFGLRSLKLSLPGLRQVHFGIQGQLSKAAHQDLHDGAVTATFSTWIPEVPTITIFSSVPDYIAPPLTIDLTYGYKNKETTTDTLHGRGGDATAAYRMYVFDKYEIAASEKWTLNDFSDRGTVPRTQRLFKVQIAYLENPATGFKVAASYENGSVGPVLTKVKQFFLGLALSKFSFSGSSSSTR